ncbi:MAG TPA: hypothetical protein VF759_04695 [Allosphingosinicella sp.]
MPPGGLTRDEALALLRRAPGGGPAEPSWTCRVGPVVLRLPNFGWRRRALPAHDLHHLMAGYPKTMRGEFQMAMWELAAGRYPDWRATLFCSPLIVAGFLWSPRRMVEAFRGGRRCQSLYSSLPEEAK